MRQSGAGSTRVNNRLAVPQAPDIVSVMGRSSAIRLLVVLLGVWLAFGVNVSTGLARNAEIGNCAHALSPEASLCDSCDSTQIDSGCADGSVCSASCSTASCALIATNDELVVGASLLCEANQSHAFDWRGALDPDPPKPHQIVPVGAARA